MDVLILSDGVHEPPLSVYIHLAPLVIQDFHKHIGDVGLLTKEVQAGGVGYAATRALHALALTNVKTCFFSNVPEFHIVVTVDSLGLYLYLSAVHKEFLGTGPGLQECFCRLRKGTNRTDSEGLSKCQRNDVCFLHVLSLKSHKAKIKRVPLDMQIPDYEELKAHAESRGETVNGFLKRAISETMERDKK